MVLSLEAATEHIKTYTGFEGNDWRLEVFQFGPPKARTRSFQWKVNLSDFLPEYFPLLLAGSFDLYFKEKSRDLKKYQIGGGIFSSVAKPHLDRIRSELAILHWHMDKYGVKREKGDVAKIKVHLDNIEARLKKKIIGDIGQKTQETLKEAVDQVGILVTEGAEKRLWIRLDNILKACTNLTEENRMEHIRRLLCHFGLEDENETEQKVRARISRALRPSRSQKERNRLQKIKPR